MALSLPDLAGLLQLIGSIAIFITSQIDRRSGTVVAVRKPVHESRSLQVTRENHPWETGPYAIVSTWTCHAPKEGRVVKS